MAQFCAECAPKDERVAVRGPAAGGQAAGSTACPSCGNMTAEGATYCPSCGHTFSAQEVEYAGFWIRLAAYLVDGILLLFADISLVLAFHQPLPRLLFQIAIALYTIGFWFAEGATPGKMVMGIKIYTAEGAPIGLGTAVVRYLGYVASLLSLGVGFLMVAFTPRKRGLHDFIANTIVIKRK
jgi:uncharacterized RDD family membrane protein YckC